MVQKKPSNKALYEEYDIEACEESVLLRQPIPAVTAVRFLSTVLGFWWQRYYSRFLVLQYDFADATAKDLLIARIRGHNAFDTSGRTRPADCFG